jgi:beta propeller repeat protein
MGRLMSLPWNRIQRAATAWILPALLSLALLFGLNSFAKADAPPTTDELSAYLQSNQLDVGVDSIEGYQQIYYMWQGSKVFVTSASYSHTQPMASGEYIAWEGLINGAGQIYVYDVLTHALTQITSSGTNQNPAVHGKLVMWESWETDHWVIYYYDGIGVFRLTTSQYSAVRPKSDGQQIIFANQEPDGWNAWSYDLASGQYTLLRTGDEASTAYPHFKNDGSISTAIHD